MTVLQSKQRVWQHLEQDPAAPTTPAADVLHALNVAQYTFVLLTLCLEKTVTFTLAAAKIFYGIRNLVPDYLRPLRLMSGEPFARLRPCRLADLDALDANWQAVEFAAPDATSIDDPPSRYFTVGLNLLGVWRPRPFTPQGANFTYAFEPPAMVADGEIPPIPEEYHETLVKFALVWLRLSEGSTELAKVMPLLGEFLTDAQKLGGFVRARSIAAGYDSLPWEIKTGDISRLLKDLLPKKEAPVAKPA